MPVIVDRIKLARGEAARLIIFDAKGKAVAELPERARMKELGQ